MKKISNYKSILLNSPITVDESFKQNYALKGTMILVMRISLEESKIYKITSM